MNNFDKYKIKLGILNKLDFKKRYVIYRLGNEYFNFIPMEEDIIIEPTDISNKKLTNKFHSNNINNFIKVIRKEIDSKYFINLYNNIDELTLRVLNDKYSKRNVKLGYYAVYNTILNEICIFQDKNVNYYHELFHMFSTRNEDETGFSIILNKKLAIGIGINEGYTEYITQKYFKETDNVYFVNVKLAKLLEQVIGKEKMMDLYVNKGLYGLINELENHLEQQQILEFIYNTDMICELAKYKYLNKIQNIKLCNAINQISATLIRYYTKKLKNDDISKHKYECNKIKIINLINKILKYFEIKYSEKICEIYYKYFDKLYYLKMDYEKKL